MVSDYIPGFEAYYDDEKVDITVRNLLEQKSGYTNVEKEYPGASETMNLSEWADSISGRELSFKPGTEYAYSNVNYNLLGLIIEKSFGTALSGLYGTKDPYPAWIKKYFCGNTR